jgi:peptidoglycan L-alanyl-D-glutamate endopeptidase CwlK
MARDITKLHPNLQEKVKLLQEKCNQVGLKIGIGECVRTVAEQDKLYAQGRTAPGTKVTNAKGSTYSSMHQWGVAVDFYRNDGTGAYNDKDGFFTKIGRIGQSIGLEWGGAWITIKDKPHFQMPDWGSGPAKLKKQYGTPDKFMKNWNIQTEKQANPYKINSVVKKGTIGESAKWVQFELVGKGYKLVVDGNFGTKSASALIDFQKKNGLIADGICGNKTIAALKK